MPELDYICQERVLTLCPEGSFIKYNGETKEEHFTDIFICIDPPGKQRVRLGIEKLVEYYIKTQS